MDKNYLKRYFIILFLLLFFYPSDILAKRGCCSHHGGVVGCNNYGKQLCADGSISPSCTCQPPIIYGCTDYNALNYNKNANKDDGSCIKKVIGCTDSNALNYDSTANIGDNSCKYKEIVVENVDIYFKTINKYNEKKNSDYKEIIVTGVNGKKEITYEIIKNYLGEIESKKIISENIIQEPIDEIIENGTSTPNLLFRLFFVLCSIMIPIYNLFIYKNSKTLFVKILNKKGNLKIFLFILYFLIIFPLFIDCCIILYDIVIKIKNLKKQKI